MACKRTSTTMLQKRMALCNLEIHKGATLIILVSTLLMRNRTSSVRIDVRFLRGFNETMGGQLQISPLNANLYLWNRKFVEEEIRVNDTTVIPNSTPRLRLEVWCTPSSTTLPEEIRSLRLDKEQTLKWSSVYRRLVHLPRVDHTLTVFQEALQLQ